MITIHYRITRVPDRDADNLEDLLLGVSGDFAINIDGRDLYQEQEFPLLELAAQLARWLCRGPKVEDDFEFESMESQDEPLLSLRRAPQGWNIGSVHQAYEDLHQFSWEELNQAFGSFLHELRKELTIVYGLEVSRILPQTI